MSPWRKVLLSPGSFFNAALLFATSAITMNANKTSALHIVGLTAASLLMVGLPVSPPGVNDCLITPSQLSVFDLTSNVIIIDHDTVG